MTRPEIERRLSPEARAAKLSECPLHYLGLSAYDHMCKCDPFVIVQIREAVAEAEQEGWDRGYNQERARVLWLFDAPWPTDGMRTGALDPRTDHRTKRFLAKLRAAIESGKEEL